MYNFIQDYFLINKSNFSTALSLSFLDIKLKYRRTILGNIWIVITYLIAIVFLSLIWTFVAGQSFSKVYPKLLVGFTTFFYINNFISSSSKILYENYKGIIVGLAQKKNSIYLRHSFILFIEYMHIYPVYFLVLYFFNYEINLYNYLLSFLGVILVTINGYLIMFLISTMCARYRDLSFLISTIMSPLLLMTPVLWDKERLGQYENFIYLNPFTSFVEVIRDPLIYNNVNYTPYLILSLSIFVFLIINSIFYKIKRKYINFWL